MQRIIITTPIAPDHKALSLADAGWARNQLFAGPEIFRLVWLC